MVRCICIAMAMGAEKEQARRDFERALREEMGDRPTETGQTVDAVTARLRRSKKEGLRYRVRADKVLAARFKPASFMRIDDALLMLYRSAFSFQLCGSVLSSAVCYTCARVVTALR